VQWQLIVYGLLFVCKYFLGTYFSSSSCREETKNCNRSFRNVCRSSPSQKKKNNTKLNRKKANKRKQEKYAYAPEHPRSAHWPPHFSPLPATPAHSLAHFLHIIIRCCFARAIRFAKLLYLIWPASCVHLPSRSHAL